MRKPTYKLVTNAYPVLHTQEINKLMSEGWHLMGDLRVIPQENAVLYVQEMNRYGG